MTQESLVGVKLRSEDVQPIRWPNITMAQPPQSLKEFLERNRRIVFPSDQDRALAQQNGREDIWNFFFRIDPEHIRAVQSSERQVFEQIQQQCDQLYQERFQRLNGLLQLLHDQAQQKGESIDEANYREQIKQLNASIETQVISFRTQWKKLAGAIAITALLLTIWNIWGLMASRGLPPAGIMVSMFFSALIPAAFLVVVAVFLYNQTRAGNDRAELSRLTRLLNQYRTDNETEPRIKQELAKLQSEYDQRKQQITEQLAILDRAIEPIMAELPKPPTDQSVIDQLRQDLERLRNGYIRSLGLEQRLRSIARVEDDDLPVVNVPNPLIFISPGQIQDPINIPPPYQPPRRLSVAQIVSSVSRHVQDPSQMMTIVDQLRAAPRQQARKALARMTERSDDPATEASPDISDRARHLLARRVITSDTKVQLLHGVYYIEYMFIADTMLVHHGFFYDFVLNRTTADRTTELFFRDIVSIEKRLEYREIPSRFETEQPLIIEDAPTIRITLPSGDQRTFTFADRSYLEAVAESLGRSDDVVDPLQEAKLNADTALQFMSQLLRKHKYMDI